MLFMPARSLCTANIPVKSRAPRDTSTRLAALLNAGRSALTRNASAYVLFLVPRVNNRARGKPLLSRPIIVRAVFLTNDLQGMSSLYMPRSLWFCE